MKYWVYIRDEVQGPFEKEQLVQMQDFGPSSLVCPEGRKGDTPEDWQKALTIPEIWEHLRTSAGFTPADIPERTKGKTIQDLTRELTSLEDEVKYGDEAAPDLRKSRVRVVELGELCEKLKEEITEKTEKNKELESLLSSVKAELAEIPRTRRDMAAVEQEILELKRRLSGETMAPPVVEPGKPGEAVPEVPTVAPLEGAPPGAPAESAPPAEGFPPIPELAPAEQALPGTEPPAPQVQEPLAPAGTEPPAPQVSAPGQRPGTIEAPEARREVRDEARDEPEPIEQTLPEPGVAPAPEPASEETQPPPGPVEEIGGPLPSGTIELPVSPPEEPAAPPSEESGVAEIQPPPGPVEEIGGPLPSGTTELPIPPPIEPVPPIEVPPPIEPAPPIIKGQGPGTIEAPEAQDEFPAPGGEPFAEIQSLPGLAGEAGAPTIEPAPPIEGEKREEPSRDSEAKKAGEETSAGAGLEFVAPLGPESQAGIAEPGDAALSGATWAGEQAVSAPTRVVEEKQAKTEYLVGAPPQRRRKSGLIPFLVLLAILANGTAYYLFYMGPPSSESELTEPGSPEPTGAKGKTSFSVPKPPPPADKLPAGGMETDRKEEALSFVKNYRLEHFNQTVGGRLESLYKRRGGARSRLSPWMVQMKTSDQYLVDFYTDVLDPSTDSDLVYEFAVDFKELRLEGRNSPARAVLSLPPKPKKKRFRTKRPRRRAPKKAAKKPPAPKKVDTAPERDFILPGIPAPRSATLPGFPSPEELSSE